MPSPVYVQKLPTFEPDSINNAVETLLAQLPATSRLCPESRVLIKPNLLGRHAPHKAVTTHPDVLRAVILALKRRGVQHITVADSPGGPYNPTGMQAIYATCGVTAVCEETGAQTYTACQCTTVPANGQLVKEFTLINPVVEADFIINLPKMKTHVLTGFSGAVKNLFGCIPGLSKPEFHMRFPEKEHFSDMIIDLCEHVHADIHLVDGLMAMEGDGPSGGKPRQAGLLFAGEDPYLLDLALCRTMGLNPETAPLLQAAQRRGLCPEELDDALLIGEDDAKQAIPGFTPPRSYTGQLDFSGSFPPFLRPLVSSAARALAPKPKIRKAGCIGCGKCAEVCPQQVITLHKGKARIAYKTCIRCFCCHEMCPAHTIQVSHMAVFGI